jgi:hypothetical protein
MGIRSFGVQKLVGVTLLFLIFLAGFPGSGGAVKPGPASTREPEAFRKLGASVAGLRFFATPTSEAVPMKARVYRTSFFNADTQYIWWEMCLNTKAKLDHPVSLIMWVTWQRADGTESNQSLVFTIPPDLPKPCLAGRWQDNRPGGWLPGSYLVTIQIDDIEVASGSFEVFQKFFKEKLDQSREKHPNQ